MPKLNKQQNKQLSPNKEHTNIKLTLWKKPIILLLLFFIFNILTAEKLGYALSGGGARGFAHIGVLKVLEEEGIYPDYIAGTSIGAVIGALYAMGYSANDLEDMCLTLNWNELISDTQKRKDLYIGQKRWTPYGNVIFDLNESWIPQIPSSVFVANNLNLELFKLTAASSQINNFSDLPVPFICNATDLITGEGVTFTKGSLMQALRASISIPSLFEPFELNGHLYIDGGISQNMPINLLHEMGADKVLGIKVNSTLRKEENLNNFVDILDQTINIGITRNLNEHLDVCDLLIEPDLTNFASTDYQHIQSIIAAGEESARQMIDQIRAFKKELSLSPERIINFDKHLDNFPVANIFVYGNNTISAAKVREYLGLETGHTYTSEQIKKACINAWNSQSFKTIYPVLEKRNDDKYNLLVYVKEREHKHLAVNLVYNNDEQLMAGLVLSLDNYLLKNSRLLGELKLGGRNEFNLDYVKNFGEQWGAYYRLFPYVTEKTIYNYRDHYKTDSVKSTEWGINSGVGVFAKDLAIAELFIYSSQTNLHSDISQTPFLPKRSVISGFGVKGYHESLDDYSFPTSGARVFGKFNFSRYGEVSDYLYSCFQGRAEFYVPIMNLFSVYSEFNYGSYLNSFQQTNLDPFVISGIDGFMGYSRYEVSAPHYQIISAGISSLISKRFFLDIGIQSLRYSDQNIFENPEDWEYCGYLGFGYKNSILPVKLYVSLNEDKDLHSFLSVGYDFDIFFFSRR
ncbi:MAG: patatin-like phospholipase family protein [Candidatus Cloacimonetes bacterium]|nr:patatin-like phospholipase family protein [Candidatus Cloacimonadota bacterium]HPH71413.1 patatin-like phospholipase family protein [Candidatus Cloacimonas sp.]